MPKKKWKIENIEDSRERTESEESNLVHQPQPKVTFQKTDKSTSDDDEIDNV